MIDINNMDALFEKSEKYFSEKKKASPTDAMYLNKLKLEIGNEYLVRFLPYTIGTEEDFFNLTSYTFYQYAWRNINTNKYVYSLSPRTYGEECPISNYFFKVRNGEDEAAKALLKNLSYKVGRYYNILVIDDPVNPENNGKVMILQAPKQITDVIDNACSDDPKVLNNNMEDYGISKMSTAMYKLSPDGINFRISVEKQGDFPNYKSSSFVARRRDLGYTLDEQKEIYSKVFKLDEIDKRSTTEEVRNFFFSTFLGAKAPQAAVREEFVERYKATEEDTYSSAGQSYSPPQPVSSMVDAGGSSEIDLDELTQFIEQNNQ